MPAATFEPRTSARVAGGLYLLIILILRCLLLPRIIGVLLGFEGLSYLANSFVHFVAPGAAPLVFKVLMVSGIGELVLCLWLIVVGVNDGRWRAQAVAAAR